MQTSDSGRRRLRDLAQWEADREAREKLKALPEVSADDVDDVPATRSVRAASAGLPGLGRRR